MSLNRRRDDAVARDVALIEFESLKLAEATALLDDINQLLEEVRHGATP
jgi:hypothetical protein